MKNWSNIEEIFSLLNNNVTYLVIRNYEDFYESILMDNHADIDLLCYKKDRRKILQLLDAEPRLGRNDGIHYRFKLSSEIIPIDIRYVGDGYYDKNWATDMLNKRILDSRGFYHMDTDNYFWSLLYHALYHKGKISDEYYQRLQNFKPKLFPATQRELENQLSKYMNQNQYYYTIARDCYLWYFFSTVCEGRIKSYPFYKIKQLLVKCKEYLERKFARGKKNEY